MRKPRVIILALALCAYAVFLLWFSGHSAPLDQAEVDEGLRRVEALVRAHGRTPDPRVRAELRTLLEDDDGDEFVMVNLIRYRQKALYPPWYSYGDDAQAADARYDRRLVPELLKRGGLPIFKGKVAGSFIQADGNDDWDVVALARYRSRRDLLEMALALAASDGDIHRWAAVEKSEVFPVQAVLSLLLLRLFVGALIGGVALILIQVIEGRQA